MSSSTHEHGSHGHDDDHGHKAGEEEWHVHAHISSVNFMVAIFAALIVLTVLTVAISRVDLGSANTVVAVIVATIKASLVSVFFMHLRHDKPFNAVIFVSSFVFLGILLFFTLDDISTRGIVDRENNAKILERTGEIAPGGYTPILPAPGEHGAAPAAGHAAPAAGHAAPAAAAPSAAPAADHAAPAAGH